MYDFAFFEVGKVCFLTSYLCAELKTKIVNCLERVVWIHENHNISQVGELRKDKVLLLYIESQKLSSERMAYS